MNQTVRPERSGSIAASQPAGGGQHSSPSTVARPAKPGIGAVFWLLVGYFFIDYVRPQNHVPGLGALKLGMILSILLGIAWLAKADKSILKEPLVVFYGLFILSVASTVVFAVNTYWTYQTTKTLAIYLFAATLPAVAFLNTREKIIKFFNIWIAMHVWLAFMSMAHAGRGSGGFLADENDWALALAMAVPYPFFLSQSPDCSKPMRILYLAALSVLILGTAFTLSRGGFVGLVVVMVGLLYFSRQRIRKLLLFIVMAAILVPLVPAKYFGEIQSISDTSDRTREDRFYSWRRGWEMFLDNPVLGIGAGNYPWKVNEYELRSSEYNPNGRLHGGRVAHSLYFTLIPELGSVGILIYSTIVVLAIRKLLRLGRVGKSHNSQGIESSDLELLARAMLVSLAGYFISGAFISVLYYPHLWYLIGFLLAVERVTNSSTIGPSSVVSNRDPIRPTAHAGQS
jgi:probable O-glycosylation ligase (exosortase A-associated)